MNVYISGAINPFGGEQGEGKGEETVGAPYLYDLAASTVSAHTVTMETCSIVTKKK